MDKGAAILDYGNEFGPNAVSKAMSNDGPNLAANNLDLNHVMPYNKVGSVNDEIKIGTPEVGGIR